EATEQEIRSLFEQCWKVLECDSIKNYGFAHAEYKTAAEDAIHNRYHCWLHDKSKASTKLHVGNITKFEEYGPGIKYDDIVRDYAFVHMEWAEDAVEADRGLDSFQAKRIHVQLERTWVPCIGRYILNQGSLFVFFLILLS
ncbi:hypothetical protein FD754_012309, partial [Muntiacus muntjak]